jgi:cation transport regulator
MHYTNVKDLPQTLQETLPIEAQVVYVEAYNRIWEQYATVTRDAAMLPTLAHQQAWDEMTRQFIFVKGNEKSQWVRKGEEPTADKPAERVEKKGFLPTWDFPGLG